MNNFISGFSDELTKCSSIKIAAPKSHLTPQSSNVAGFRYDASKKQLFVTYKGGGTYKYNGVPRAVFKKLRTNKSVGKTINRSVKAPGFEYEKVAKKKRQSDTDPVRDLTKAAQKIDSQTRARFGSGNGKQKKKPTAQERFYANNYKTPSKAKKTPSQRYYERKRKLERMAKKAGAVKKQVTWNGLTMKLEYLKGDERSGINGATGKSWSRTMRDNYGYMPGTYGKGDDGEALDVYFNSDANPESSKVVYNILQRKKTGEHDESKFMVGYDSAADARKAFLRNMPAWAFGSMSSISMNKFRTLVGQPTKKVDEPK